ncbi:MAG: transcription initiation factor IIB [Promethearchaeia archaeon]|nr:MAG: transcription initiation factor IIB [Candidatus Lokiarchaeia archaeon]
MTDITNSNVSHHHSFNSGDLNHCPECNSFNIIIDQARGENVCATCGLVLSHHLIDNAREGRRAFSYSEKSKRDQTGSPVSPLLPDLGLSTVIDTSIQLSQRMKRIIKWNTRMSWSNRNMLIAATEIKRIGALLNLPQRVKEYAAKIYRQAFKLKLLRGRSIKAMVVACLYYACRSDRIPRTMQEIMRFSDSEPRDVRRCYRTIIRELKLTVPALDPILLVPKYITALQLDNNVEKTAIKIIKHYRKRYNVAGRDPKGILAAALYVASLYHHQPRSQSRIAKTIKVTEVTLRSRFKEISRFVKIPAVPSLISP